jgi:hypothetical protein
MVIGFRKGTMPMMNEPCFVTKPEDVQSLVWDSNCGINLANYLTNRKEKIAIVAKGCDSAATSSPTLLKTRSSAISSHHRRPLHRE